MRPSLIAPPRLPLIVAVLTLFSLTPAGVAQVVEAIALPRHDLRLGFTIPGRVAETLVEPGQTVELGQPLVRLDDQESQAQIDLYTLRANSALDEDAAEAEWRLAQNEEARVQDAYTKSAAGAFEVERAVLQTKRRHADFAIARQRRAEAQALLRQAQARHREFTLLAPLSGVVEQVLVSPGELVEASRPVLRLVVIDPLRIDAPFPTRSVAAGAVGAPAWATVIGQEPAQPIEGRIVHIAQVADAASDTRIVRIEIPNPGHVPAGSHVLVTLTPPDLQAPPTAEAASDAAPPR